MDVIWTTGHQPNNPYKTDRDNILMQVASWTRKERHATRVPPPGPTRRHVFLQAMIATLSMGPVGIGDGPGMTNVTLVKQIARADARLIHPSYPATPIDVMYYPPSLRPTGEIWQVRARQRRPRRPFFCWSRPCACPPSSPPVARFFGQTHSSVNSGAFVAYSILAIDVSTAYNLRYTGRVQRALLLGKATVLALASHFFPFLTRVFLLRRLAAGHGGELPRLHRIAGLRPGSAMDDLCFEVQKRPAAVHQDRRGSGLSARCPPHYAGAAAAKVGSKGGRFHRTDCRQHATAWWGFFRLTVPLQHPFPLAEAATFSASRALLWPILPILFPAWTTAATRSRCVCTREGDLKQLNLERAPLLICEDAHVSALQVTVDGIKGEKLTLWAVGTDGKLASTCITPTSNWPVTVSFA